MLKVLFFSKVLFCFNRLISKSPCLFLKSVVLLFYLTRLFSFILLIFDPFNSYPVIKNNEYDCQDCNTDTKCKKTGINA